MKNKKKQEAPRPAEDAFKQKALEVAFSQIDKQYGSGAVMMLGQSGSLGKIARLPGTDWYTIHCGPPAGTGIGLLHPHRVRDPAP